MAWAAFAVLLVAPESLLSASFQMSFAAVIALVAGYELLRERRARIFAERTMATRVTLYVAAVALTSVIAIAATTPFAVYHFNRIAWFGLAGNLIAVPLTALWIMPWAIGAFLLLPFGLEALALKPMGLGHRRPARRGRAGGRLAGRDQRHSGHAGGGTRPAHPGRALALPLAAGLAPGRPAGDPGRGHDRSAHRSAGSPGQRQRQALRLARARRRAVAVHRAREPVRGRCLASPGGRDGSPAWPGTGSAVGGRLRCDRLGCIYRADGQVVALVQDPRALAEDCALASIVISREPVPARRCRGPRVVIDRFDLWRHGGHALWPSPDGVRVERVRDRRGRRPWVARRGRD